MLFLIFFSFCPFLTKAQQEPVFSAVSVFDGRPISHYSDEKKAWILTEKNLTNFLQQPPEPREWFLKQLKTLSNSNSNCTNCSDPRVLQRLIGCELEKHLNGSVKSLTAFDEYGFDGEDLIAFNSDTMQWTEKNPKAKATKLKWNRLTGRNIFLQGYLKRCISTINESIIQIPFKMIPPDVHVFVREDPHDHSSLVLSCLATDFYPRDIEMNIISENFIVKDQTTSGIRPNADGTFQIVKRVKISHQRSYVCEVIHSNRRYSFPWDGAHLASETSALTLILAIVFGVITIIGVIAMKCCKC